MTVPMDYRLASARFDAFLREVADETGLTTTNQAFTVVDGVLRTFRSRLTLEQGIGFARTLPPLLRALFVAGWDTAGEPEVSWDRVKLADEVLALRRHHNFAPPTAIRDVALVLRRHVDEQAFDACLAALPEGARAFWSVSLDKSG